MFRVTVVTPDHVLWPNQKPFNGERKSLFHVHGNEKYCSSRIVAAILASRSVMASLVVTKSFSLYGCGEVRVQNILKKL